MHTLTQELTALGSRRVIDKTHRLLAVLARLVRASWEHRQARQEQAGSEILQPLWEPVEYVARVTVAASAHRRVPGFFTAEDHPPLEQPE
jgi:hypothetical protein